jgi:ABC-type glutathione transport system ATPase component
VSAGDERPFDFLGVGTVRDGGESTRIVSSSRTSEIPLTDSPVLSLRSLSKVYRVGLADCTASARALDDVHLDVAPGEVVAVIGAANAGKTTLLRCAAGLLSADAGTIERARLSDGRVVVVKYLESPIELTRLCVTDCLWHLALVDNADSVCGDVGGAFALLTAARQARRTGAALLLAARDQRAIASVADRVLVLERGRLRSAAPHSQTATMTRVAESTIDREGIRSR